MQQVHQPPVGRLEVVVGSMFSGKTEELIRRAKRSVIARRRVIIFKPAIDTRYEAESVFSHDGRSIEAHRIPVDAPRRIEELALAGESQVVAIDEAQFFGEEIIEVVRRLVGAGRRVILSGLDMDFAGRPFGPMPTLMALADEVLKLKAICVRCGESATFTQRLIDGEPAAADDPLVLIGGQEAYEARCRACHEVAPPRHAGANGVLANGRPVDGTWADGKLVVGTSANGVPANGTPAAEQKAANGRAQDNSEVGELLREVGDGLREVAASRED